MDFLEANPHHAIAISIANVLNLHSLNRCFETYEKHNTAVWVFLGVAEVMHCWFACRVLWWHYVFNVVDASRSITEKLPAIFLECLILRAVKIFNGRYLTLHLISNKIIF